MIEKYVNDRSIFQQAPLRAARRRQFRSPHFNSPYGANARGTNRNQTCT
jgi:hypothetical protein